MTRMTMVLGALLVAGACSKSGTGSAPPVAFKDGAEGLAELFRASQAACASKDYTKGKQIVLSVLPGKDQLNKALKDDAPSEFVDKTLEQYKEVPRDAEKIACIFAPPGRTEIKVHKSTTEEIVAYKEGTPAFEEFPGGARKLAESVLKPQMAFYEVETTELGNDKGTKFHMFFWDGAQWRMMGPAWRALR